MKNNKNENIKQYEEYFADILIELEREFAKTEAYSKKTDDELQKFEGMISSKGGQHYLVEHIKNAINLQSQRQSIIKDKFNIKKAILDYAMKSDLSEMEGKSLFDEISRIVEIEKERIKRENSLTDKESEEMDDLIDELLNEHI
jgi:hypothetical protein